MLAQAPQAGLCIELSRAKVFVPQKSLYLVNRHPRIQQEGGHTGPEPVRGDTLRQARALGRVLDHELHRAWGIAGMAVALEQIGFQAATVRKPTVRVRQRYDAPKQ
jgi:hypothetical protein